MTKDGDLMAVESDFLFTSFLTPEHLEELSAGAPEFAKSLLSGDYQAPVTDPYLDAQRLPNDYTTTVERFEKRIQRKYGFVSTMRLIFASRAQTQLANEREAQAMNDELEAKSQVLKEFLTQQLSTVSEEINYGAKLETGSDYLVDQLLEGSFDAELGKTVVEIESRIQSIRDKVSIRHNICIPLTRTLIKLNAELRKTLTSSLQH
jgi:hypothetical protein